MKPAASLSSTGTAAQGLAPGSTLPPPADERALHLLDATMFWNPNGGVRRYIDAKRRWLRQQTGWRHTVATPRPDEESDGHGALAVPSLPLPGSGGAYRLPWRRGVAAEALRRAAPDLIESADPYRLAWSSLDAAQALGIPAVAFCHSNLEQMAALSIHGRWWQSAARRAARRYAAHLYGQFDLVLAPSAAMCAHLRQWGVARVVHQPLGVASQVFDPRRASPAWRRALGLPAHARLLVYAGRFAPEKNLQLLADAVRRLGPPYWLLAIGDGPARPQGERVVVMPTLREPLALATAIASCDVFVHAGAQETFGLSVLEALACGVPVVARAAEGLAELVDERVGAGVPHCTPEAYAEAIASVFAADRQGLRAAARQRALALDWQRVLPRLSQRYRHLSRPAASAGATA